MQIQDQDFNFQLTNSNLNDNINSSIKNQLLLNQNMKLNEKSKSIKKNFIRPNAK